MAFLGHGVWQALRLSKSKNEQALTVFKSNVTAGFILLAGLAFAAIIGGDRRPAPNEPTPEPAQITTDAAVDNTAGWQYLAQPESRGGFPDIARILGINSGEEDPQNAETQITPAEQLREALPDWVLNSGK